MDTNNKGKYTASPFAQVKKGRVQDLGRGSCSKSMSQSPASGLPLGVTDDHVQSHVEIATVQEETTHHSGGSGMGVEKHQTETHEEVVDIPTTSTLGSRGAGGLDTEPGDGADFGRQNTGLRSVTPGLTKNQKRNLRKKFARQQSKTAPESSGGGFKRPRSVISTPSPGAKEIQKKPRRDGRPISFASAVKTKLALVRESFPATKLSVEDSCKIQKAILAATFSNIGGEFRPQIDSHSMSRGAQVIQCGDNATVDWIRAQFHGNKEVLDNEALIVMNANDLPKPIKVAFKTKDIHTREHGEFLSHLDYLNPDLKPLEWRVLQLTAEQQSTRWIFEVDIEDLERIRRANYGAYTGLDRGFFKVLHDPNKKESSLEDKADPEEVPSIASSKESTISTSDLQVISDLTLDSGSEGTLQPDSPCSMDEIDKALQVLQESKIDSSPEKGHSG